MNTGLLLKWMGFLGLSATVGALGHHFGGQAHIRRKLGQAPLAKATCFNCHFVSTARLPWAKPRPHHDAPAGLALSPDGSRIFIALDDRDEVAEADTASGRVLRRVKVEGAPYGLALNAPGSNLYVACKNSDQVRVLDAASLREIGSVAVGLGPVALAFCRTPQGDRLVVANSISDNISVLDVSPLNEVCRLAAGREPFAVAVSPDGTRAFVANRLVNLESTK